jgi:predicted NAD/FAD-binding protein
MSLKIVSAVMPIHVLSSGKAYPFLSTQVLWFLIQNAIRIFCQLLHTLGVGTIDTSMSLSVSIAGGIEFSSNVPKGIFADRRNLFSLSYWTFLFEIIRFNRQGKASLSLMQADTNSTHDVPLSQFLDTYHFSEKLRKWYLYPMLASIWSCKSSDAGDFPTQETLQFLNNHQLLDTFSGPTWQTVKGGSRAYVTRMTDELIARGVSVRTAARITEVTRTSESVTIHTDSGIAAHDSYDYCVFATHADTALTLLAEPTVDEKNALSLCTYSRNTTVLHSDSRLMPENKDAWASWNYRASDTTDSLEHLSITYNMNLLQSIDEKYPMYVTLNPDVPINPTLIHGTYEYTHPHFSIDTVRAQKVIALSQGKNRTYFAGAYLGYGFHEDGLVSGMEVAKLLGASIWKL